MRARLFCLISLRFAASNQFSPARARHKNRDTFDLPLLCLLTFLLAGPAQAGPDLVTFTNGVATAQGNQTNGIASDTDFFSPPVTTSS